MKKNIYISLLLLIALLFGMQLKAQEKPIKLISYNVYWGMKEDSTQNKSKFAEWIKAQDADIVALQEMNKFTQESLEKLANSYGHPYAILLKDPDSNGAISFPVAFTSKYPIVNVERVTSNILHGFVKAEIAGHGLIVTHFHPFSAKKRMEALDLILETINADPKPNKKWLLMGDLNSVSPLDKEEYDNGKVLAMMRELAKKKPTHPDFTPQNLVNNELDYSINQKILDKGFVDAFKFFHPIFEPSAPTKLKYDQSHLPLRYDYVYVSGNMKDNLVKCNLIKDDFTDIYSDHYPVVLYFNK